MIPVEKNLTGTKKTGIQRIPAGITYLGCLEVVLVLKNL
jgi:hypothetical protein